MVLARPSVADFQNSFKSLLLNNLISRHSPYSNCEEDFSVGALDNLRSFLKCSNPQTFINEMLLIIIKPTMISECTVAFISDFLVKRLFKIIKCENCQENIKENVLQDARKFTPTSQLVQPGKFFMLF